MLVTARIEELPVASWSRLPDYPIANAYNTMYVLPIVFLLNGCISRLTHCSQAGDAHISCFGLLDILYHRQSLAGISGPRGA